MASDGEFNREYHDVDNQLIVKKINTWWIQRFCEAFDIVYRKKNGKLRVSDEKQASIEKGVAAHLENLKREFEAGNLDENSVYNMDETHLVFDMDNGYCLGTIGTTAVTYQDVVGGGEGMTLVIKIRGGVNACLEPLMVVFQNPNSSYPIRGVPDIPGVA